MTNRISTHGGGAIVAALLLGAVAVFTGSPAPASADSVAPTVGWWSQAPSGALGAGPAPVVPPGGLYVANGPAGPAGVSALRFAAGSGAAARVTLAFGSDATPSTAALAACPTTIAWTATAGGSLDQAPSYDCGVRVALGTIDPNAGTVTWVLPPAFARDGVIDVALVPASGASPFNAPFQAPADGAVEVTGPSDQFGAEEPASAGPADSTSSAQTANGFGDAGATTPSAGIPPFDPSASIHTVSPPAGTGALPQVAAPSASAPSRSRSQTTPRVALATPRLSDQRGQRLLAVALLAALAIGCYRLSITNPRPLRSIVPFRSAAPEAQGATARSRGIGRYARPRQDPARSL